MVSLMPINASCATTTFFWQYPPIIKQDPALCVSLCFCSSAILLGRPSTLNVTFKKMSVLIATLTSIIFSGVDDAAWMVGLEIECMAFTLVV